MRYQLFIFPMYFKQYNHNLIKYSLIIFDQVSQPIKKPHSMNENTGRALKYISVGPSLAVCMLHVLIPHLSKKVIKEVENYSWELGFLSPNWNTSEKHFQLQDPNTLPISTCRLGFRILLSLVSEFYCCACPGYARLPYFYFHFIQP